MERTIKLTIVIQNPDDNTPTGEEIKDQLQKDFAEVLSGESDVKVTLDTEYDE